jgi:hypothetical protein
MLNKYDFAARTLSSEKSHAIANAWQNTGNFQHQAVPL